MTLLNFLQSKTSKAYQKIFIFLFFNPFELPLHKISYNIFHKYIIKYNEKKILILIHSDIYIRNYLETNAFEILIKKYNCHFVVISNDVHNKKVLNKNKKNFLSYVSYSKQELINFQNIYIRIFL